MADTSSERALPTWACTVCGEECDPFMDVRRWSCGCYVHKECHKSGERCRDHPDAVRGDGV